MTKMYLISDLETVFSIYPITQFFILKLFKMLNL